MQRAVTADELRSGVHVNLLELRERAAESGAERPMVVAWIEAGEPNLEFDGRTARPRPGSVYGVVKREARQDAVQISLNRNARGLKCRPRRSVASARGSSFRAVGADLAHAALEVTSSSLGERCAPEARLEVDVREREHLGRERVVPRREVLGVPQRRRRGAARDAVRRGARPRALR